MDLVSLFIRRCGAKNGSRSFRRQSPGLKKGPCLSDSSLSNRTYNHEKKKKYIYIYIYITGVSSGLYFRAKPLL